MKRPPARHWRCYGDDPLPSGTEALDEPFSAFPSWYLRITCDRCGKLQVINGSGHYRPGVLRHLTCACVIRRKYGAKVGQGPPQPSGTPDRSDAPRAKTALPRDNLSLASTLRH